MPRLPTPTDFPPTLTLDIIPPSTGQPLNILILLHGLGDTQTPFTHLGRNLNLPETACISIQGLHPVPEIFTGSPAPSFHWGDDILVDEQKGEIEMDSGFEISIGVLGGVVREVVMGRCGFPGRNIFFLGFGQGGMVALRVADCGFEGGLGGVVSIGGGLPSSTTATSSITLSSTKNKTPVLVCGGSRSSQVTRQAVDVLKARFADMEYVKWEKYEDSMPRSREEMLPIMKFFARRLRSRAGVPEGAVEV